MSVFFMDFDMAPSVIWARDLYDQMQIRSDFRKWFPRMCQYGFVEGRDYEFVPRVRPQDEGGRTVQRYVKDYRITLEMAKQLYKLHHFHKNDCFRSCEGQHCMGTDHWMQAVIELLHQHKCKSHAPPKRFYESQPPDSLVTTTQIAKEYGCGAKVFNRLLHLHGIQYRANNQWVLYAKHHLTVQRSIPYLEMGRDGICRVEEHQMIGTYYRLSLADEDVGADKAESNSIQGQRGLVEGYIMARPELATEPRQEYVDDGYSGTSTSRPAFQRLIQDAQDGKVKTIIVKDFSRFARDYIEAGDYMERIFPLLGVRFISVNDGYDSGMQIGNDVRGLEVAIKNIINASYSRDLSAKIAAADHVMQKKGMYLGGYRPFGFLPDPNDCHKLILDPVASQYVRLIFELALQGNRTGTIAKILNEKQIPTPAAYHVAENHVYSEQKAWDLQRSHWTSGKR